MIMQMLPHSVMTRVAAIIRGGIGFALMILFLSSAQANDRVYPTKWEWSVTQERQIKSLTQQCQKNSGSGFWELTRGSITVRSDVSAALAAEGFMHVQRAIPQCPQALKLPPSGTRPKKVRFVVSLHRTEESLTDEAPDCYAEEGYSEFAPQDDGSALATVHLLSDWDLHPGAANNLAECIDVGVMQRHLARLVLEMWRPGKPFPPFFAKGCESYYEVFDIYRMKSAIPGIPRSDWKTAFVDAIVDGKGFRPSLAEKLQLTSESFDKAGELNGGLSNQFIQFFLQKAERQKFVHQALAHLEGGGKIEARMVAAMEADWHRHLYQTLALSRLVLYSDYKTETGLPRAAGVGSISNYGNKPALTLIPSKGGVHDLAWFNGGSGTIHILRCDEQGKKIDEFSPKFIENARALLGATRLPDDRGYAVGYSHDNSHGNKGSEFWVAGFDLSGDQIFNTRIFGAIDLKVEKSKGGPGGAGTARMVYNEKAGHIGFYLAHNMLWGDGVRHQAGFIGFINEKGKRLPGGNGWFFSHNFDQRLIASGGDFYALAHGDAYPRALGFSRWSGNGGKKLAGSNYHTIPGESGANKTNCQTGGLVALPGGRFAVVFASLNAREGHDICIKILDSSGKTTKERWLTENGERDGSSTYPRIARYGEHIFVAWHDSDKSGLQHIVVDRSLETVVPQSSLEEVKLSPYDDLYNLDNGAIVWAVPQDKNKVRIFRIDQPAVLAKALIERNAKVE